MLLIAVDAGNSKTDVALVDTSGRILSTSRGGGFNAPASGVTAAVDMLGRLVDEVLEAAARTAATMYGRRPGAPPVRHVSACLSNVDLPVEEEELTLAVAERGWGRTVEVHNDTFALLRAGLPADSPRGVAVVCGAGINCVGISGDGRTARLPAVGTLSGDWGGGGQLADEAIWYAARAADGRGDPTALARALPRHFALDTMYELITELHRGGIPDTRRHELVPVLFAVAGSGDRIARGLVHRQAEKIVSLAVVALSRLGLLQEPVPVILGGGVLAARQLLLNDRVTELLAERAPLARPVVVAAPPVLGSALLGLDAIGAPRETYRRLCAQFDVTVG
ncbi:N-acetylglucosamine kinase [Streptomyces clavuligerus]|uniref:Putative kinase n=1 Tax=Streptomyces clavuligerus TaxID=1901 RepID=D5SKY4_STRCL|nr:BadF/BadG/BcrA/BcrD ATPase family protein [Streptomyces clavuligerus]ANW22464.1 kinase [Streptomyces clavuligerus]AXU17368.1 kinase [Streptomyces clavuligerus]EFG04577.1 putative kinase [Streptomyces clavuligerus]MBY6306975.1 kinase [Streptomyces clavuligerus]QCS10441.1 kinase [Streptomyces clavuligerus]